MKWTNEVFISEVQKLHPNLDFSHSVFTGTTKPLTFICKIHGEKTINRAYNLLSQNGCQECAKEIKNKKNSYTLNDIRTKSKLIYGDKYEYIDIYKKGRLTYLKIVCPIHGEFCQLLSNHLKGCGCKQCGIEKRAEERKASFDEIVNRARQFHGDKYIYINDFIKNGKRFIKYICPIHGIQEQYVSNHLLRGTGCKYCGGTALMLNEEMKKKLFDKFKGNIDFVSDTNGTTNISTFKCNVCGKTFKRTFEEVMQLFSGCPFCTKSKGEKTIEDFLNKNKILFDDQKIFSDLKDQSYLSYDFYLKSNNLLIEYNGLQHYKPTRFGNISIEEAEKNFKIQQKHDAMKKEYAFKNNIKLLIIPYWEFDNIDKILKENIIFEEV